VRRGGKVVLPSISLDIPAGIITGLLGPSGSGKTTLMRAIVGVQVVDSGVVDVLGMPAGSPPLRTKVGYVTQTPSIYTDLTVRENLSYFARILRASPKAVERVVETVGLTGQLGQVAATLSGGERARASLATALLNDPELLVLDEPTVGLDPVLRNEIWAHFHALAARGTTLLVSSHVMDEAERCDSLLLMRDGDILAAGAPAELRERAGVTSVEGAFLQLVASRSVGAGV
jgi:ABC-2 type transport system ATP-binding protein